MVAPVLLGFPIDIGCGLFQLSASEHFRLASGPENATGTLLQSITLYLPLDLD
jgi:hypothetical protein